MNSFQSGIQLIHFSTSELLNHSAPTHTLAPCAPCARHVQLDLTVDLSSENPPRSNAQCSNPGTLAQAFASSSHLGEYPTRPGTVARGREAGEGRATRARHKPKKADGGKGNGTRKSKEKKRRKVASKAYAVSQYLLHRFIRMEP
jgi:hypothetical protein